MRKIASLLLALVMLVLPAAAVEVASGDVYCFSAGDFSGEDLAGICVAGVPDNGTVLLGDRIIRPGDILLTADGVILNVNDDLLGCKEGLAAGDSISITWRSAETGEQMTADIILVEDYILRGE